MKKFSATLKKKFDAARSRPLNGRERVLLLALIATALVIWALSLSSGFRRISAQNSATQNAIEQNEIILGTREIVETRLEKKAAELAKGSEISETDLLSAIGTLAAETGLKPESSRPTDKSRAPFDIVSVRITLRNAPLENLVEFDERISDEFPSVAVTEARFSPTSEDGMTLNATYEITSFLLQSAAQNPLR